MGQVTIKICNFSVFFAIYLQTSFKMKGSRDNHKSLSLSDKLIQQVEKVTKNFY